MMNYYKKIKIGYMSKKFNFPLFLIGSLLSTLTLNDVCNTVTQFFQILGLQFTQGPQTNASGDNLDQFEWSWIAYFNQKIVIFAILS